jgi:cysteine desulfurase
MPTLTMAADPHPGLATGPIYLDYNATTPVDPRVIDAALPYLSPTSETRPAITRTAIRLARRSPEPAPNWPSCSAAPAEAIVFTGSGSEADNLAICGVAAAHSRGIHLITSL